MLLAYAWMMLFNCATLETFPDISEKRRLEKLESEVSNLGAERERARAAKQETNTQIKHNIRSITDRTRLDISEKQRLEKLESEVSNLGAERERARAAK